MRRSSHGTSQLFRKPKNGANSMVIGFRFLIHQLKRYTKNALRNSRRNMARWTLSRLAILKVYGYYCIRRSSLLRGSTRRLILGIWLPSVLKGSTRFLSRIFGDRRSTSLKCGRRFGLHWITNFLSYDLIKRSSRSIRFLSLIRLYIGPYKAGSCTKRYGRSRSSGNCGRRTLFYRLFVRAPLYAFIGSYVYMY